MEKKNAAHLWMNEFHFINEQQRDFDRQFIKYTLFVSQ